MEFKLAIARTRYETEDIDSETEFKGIACPGGFDKAVRSLPLYRHYPSDCTRERLSRRQLHQNLAARLTGEFGKGFTETNLKYFRQFYQAFPPRGGSGIRHTLCDQLNWSHYRLLMRVESADARAWYLKEAIEQNWSVRALERQINSLGKCLATGICGSPWADARQTLTDRDVGNGGVAGAFTGNELTFHALPVSHRLLVCS